MIKIPDAASLSALRCLQTSLGRRCGGSTGTNFIAALHLAREMHEAGRQGSIVTVLCDSGERYTQTYYNDDWLAERGFKDIGRLRSEEHTSELQSLMRTSYDVFCLKKK